MLHKQVVCIYIQVHHPFATLSDGGSVLSVPNGKGELGSLSFDLADRCNGPMRDSNGDSDSDRALYWEIAVELHKYKHTSCSNSHFDCF